jgi:mannose-6-phosphate isomerase class I
MYKRFYFVDWVALNRHKADVLPDVDLIVDEQRPDEPTFASGDEFRAALTAMSHNYFRVRPWFEPGPWGGQWIKQHISQLPQDAPNYAWSFELIVPENGLMLQSDDTLLEVSFDWLMFYAHREVLGKSADRFGYEFPIRFDFLDTFEGGNLSVQCHPRPEYARRHFGENFTQDETYYILDCALDAHVYLGFREGINPAEFRQALEHSYHDAVPMDVERYVNVEPAHKHDLFLIPNGTIHCSGQNNLVLEISATPYIFTFKMYDWLRLDLDGKPRPLNIQRAFDNLYFDRKGERIKAEHISRPVVLASGDGWRVMHLPTHAAQFYDVHRIEFDRQVDVQMEGSCHVLSLVEGSSVILETSQGLRQKFSYAETFVVPAAAQSYRLINGGDQPIKVVKCFVKDNA